ncbi:hypothetical protein BT63DRAFT_437281 [Microthyrium microscopicum]|uniref:Uncharacterized protein n=1 Tax=Microthyrium microscopicum TaxID=703497 RepID=A0A6A6UQB9_9PEZI|nr:hypothetical protein BT63DRAFT_437281 [Microthyrium microscopicum]
MGVEDPQHNPHKESFGDEWVPTPVALFQTCKTLHQEACEVFYGENVFVLDASKGIKNFDMLSSVSTQTLTLVRTLQIEFKNEFKDANPQHQWISPWLHEWERTCEFLASKFPRDANTVSIDLSVPYIDRSPDAYHFLGSMCTLAPLARVRYHDERPQRRRRRRNGLIIPLFPTELERQNNFRTLRMLEHHRFSFTSRQIEKRKGGFFPFLSLPVELQEIVLSHTDLVGNTRTGLPLTKAINHASQCCSYCMDPNLKPDSKPEERCCCSVPLHSYSSTCRCNPLRSSGLLLTSKYVRELGLAVLQRENIFFCSGHLIDMLHEVKSLVRPSKPQLPRVRELRITIDHYNWSSSFHSASLRDPVDPELWRTGMLELLAVINLHFKHLKLLSVVFGSRCELPQGITDLLEQTITELVKDGTVKYKHCIVDLAKQKVNGMAT